MSFSTLFDDFLKYVQLSRGKLIFQILNLQTYNSVFFKSVLFRTHFAIAIKNLYQFQFSLRQIIEKNYHFYLNIKKSQIK